MAFCGVTSAGPPVDADAPLASDSDSPAAPKTGTALLRRFRFEACLERAISGSPILFIKIMFGTILDGTSPPFSGRDVDASKVTTFLSWSSTISSRDFIRARSITRIERDTCAGRRMSAFGTKRTFRD